VSEYYSHDDHSYLLCCSGASKTSDNFFSPAEDYDKEEDDGRHKTMETTEKMVESATPLARLPNPLSGLADAAADDDDERRTSVFTNYFHKAEERKLAVLEHHVKLTTEELKKTNGEQEKRQNKKRVCIGYQRGRCRFGGKCRFAHSISSETNDTGVISPTEVTTFRPKFGLLPSAQLPLNMEPDDNDDDGMNAQKKRKLRVGVTDSLVPPKRAMKSLDQQRKDERPWTVTPQ